MVETAGLEPVLLQADKRDAAPCPAAAAEEG